jgi:hypothetical protein
VTWQIVCFVEISLSENEVCADGPMAENWGKRKTPRQGWGFFVLFPRNARDSGLSNSQPQTCMSD